MKRTLVALVALFVVAPAQAAPSQVHLTWTGPTDTTMTFTWRSSTSAGQVDYGPSVGYGRTVKASSSAYGGDWLHSVEVTNLTPGTTYHYRCGTAGDFSPDWTFTTAPPAGTPFHFVAWGDSRTDAAARRTVRTAVEARHPAFSIFTGDLVEDGTSQLAWNQWFVDMEPLIAVSPLMPAIGNHENNAPNYYAQFDLPPDAAPAPGYEPESFYAFDYAGVHFVSLSTEPVGTAGGPQAIWLENDLAAASKDPKTRWIVAFGHRPPYSSGEHGSWLPSREVFVPIFEKYGVAVSFWGHDHDYERTFPLLGGRRDDARGLPYVVAGGAGAPLRTVGTSDFTAYSSTELGFVDVAVTDRSLVVEARDGDGVLFDRTEIVHAASTTDGGTAGGDAGPAGTDGGGAGAEGSDGGAPTAGDGCGCTSARAPGLFGLALLGVLLPWAARRRR